jgi:hypothetical protein
MSDEFRKCIANMIKHLTEGGIKALDEMVATEQVTPDERRALQYKFCRGMGDAQRAMESPKEAVATGWKLQGDSCVNSTMDHKVRMAAERVLAHILGQSWRVRKLGPMESTPAIDARGSCFEALREAVTAKPSEIERPEWADPATEERPCRYCGGAGHYSGSCPKNAADMRRFERPTSGDVSSDQQG